MKFLIPIVLFAFAAMPANADTVTEYGQIISMKVITDAHDHYNFYRGKLTFRASNIDRVFTWGGSTCTGKNLTDAQVATLQAVLLDSNMRVQFQTKAGQGGNTCITGFEMSSRKFVP